MSTTVNKISIVFQTDAGSSFTTSFNYASENLTTEAGKAYVEKYAEDVLDLQPFAVVLVACTGAEYTVTTTTDIDVSGVGANE